MHKIYNPGLYILGYVPLIILNGITCPLLNLKTVADMLMKLHPYVKHYVMIYDVDEL